jgi:hypothetical protein
MYVTFIIGRRTEMPTPSWPASGQQGKAWLDHIQSCSAFFSSPALSMSSIMLSQCHPVLFCFLFLTCSLHILTMLSQCPPVLVCFLLLTCSLLVLVMLSQFTLVLLCFLLLTCSLRVLVMLSQCPSVLFYFLFLTCSLGYGSIHLQS